MRNSLHLINCNLLFTIKKSNINLFSFAQQNPVSFFALSGFRATLSDKEQKSGKNVTTYINEKGEGDDKTMQELMSNVKKRIFNLVRQKISEWEPFMKINKVLRLDAGQTLSSKLNSGVPLTPPL